MLADSNLFIYAASGNYPYLITWFSENQISVSAVSTVETLGYHKLKLKEKKFLQTIFSELKTIYPTQDIFSLAIDLRQQQAMSLGDALIAATALYHNLSLATLITSKILNGFHL